ncbi:hypothetical protein LXA43DRAFT_1098612 [Ganoderma leucocontextum]|nr:hypothetical protein LXA43DRAFT_1098612 [Ganoderma leucocontextum]
MTSSWDQYFPPQPVRSVDDVPDQASKTFLITGGNAGLRKEQHLHVLANNAGAMNPPLAQLTSQNYDPQFWVNVPAHFYFAQPVLLATAKATGQKARVLNFSCAAAAIPGAKMLHAYDRARAPEMHTCAALSTRVQIGVLLNLGRTHIRTWHGEGSHTCAYAHGARSGPKP